MRIVLLKIMKALWMAKEFHPGRYKMVIYNPLSIALLLITCTVFGTIEFVKAFWALAHETLSHSLTDYGPPPQGLQGQEADLATERSRIRRERLAQPIEPTREFTPQGQGGNDQPSRLDPPEYG